MASYLRCGGLGLAAMFILGCGARTLIEAAGSADGGGGGGGRATVEDPAELCPSVCAAEKDAACPTEIGAGDCTTSCLKTFANLKNCVQELAASLACGRDSLNQTGDCGNAPACVAVDDALTACFDSGSGP